MKYRSILEFGLNNWYNWLVETNDNELTKWYTKVFSHALKNAKNIKNIERFDICPKLEEDITSKIELEPVRYIRNLL